MNLAKRSLVTIDDLSKGETEALFSLADEMLESPDKQLAVCQGKVLASLFFEPSTRTRFSFETAMHRLGGSVITAAEAGATSLAKGETIADTARVVGSYADIIVIRHPWEGAVKVVADYAGVPVINAGDGGHQHPTQTLCDLYAIKKEKKTIRGLKVALWGDLKYGRTTHSLIFALAKFGANILFFPSPGLEVPEYVLKKVAAEYGGELERYEVPDQPVKDNLPSLKAMYITPDSSHQLAMMPVQAKLKTEVDVLYVTRPQKERFTTGEKEKLEGKYPVVDKSFLKGPAFRSTAVMHPLPRVDELSSEIDTDPRSIYFKQAAWGVPVRMALLALLLGSREAAVPGEDTSYLPMIDYPAYRHDSGVKCSNPRCVSVQATETRYLKPAFKIVNREPLTLRCVFCEHEFEPEYVASSEWHEGSLENKKYHGADSQWARKIKPENLIVFSSRLEAEASGFKPGYDVGTEHPNKDHQKTDRKRK